MTGKATDLHMHSHYSDDGEFSPAELVQKCKAQGIEQMAIADHNCARANVQGRQAAQAAGIAYVPAIEIDCTFQGVNFHVLGYGIDDQSVDFAAIEGNIRSQGLTASKQMLHATRELGFHVTEEELAERTADSYWKDQWTGELFAEVLLEKPEYREHALLRPYRAGGARGSNPYVNFYWDYYAQGKPCYAAIFYPDFARVVEVIHQNRGYAVLAHPGMNLKGHETLLEPMIQTGLDGIEAFSSYHSPEQAACFCKTARSHNLFFTCGSDYHGKTKPALALGEHGCLIADDSIPFFR